ncbi:MAG TPA: hypothetical protein VK473_04515 [Terriglobales bacterium]|nr:hypothetical protein [Terriglobales bacterium]
MTPRVWIHPGKFWAATRLMSAEQVKDLAEAIARMVEENDLHGLSQFKFVSFESPLRQKAA